MKTIIIDGVKGIWTPEEEVITDKEIKVALVVGHYRKEKGAHSNYFGNSEFNFWYDFLLRYDFNFKYDWFIHNDDTSYTRRQEQMGEHTKDFDLVIELHFNSFNGEANGSRALFNEINPRTEKLANKFTELMSVEEFKPNSNKPIRLNDDKVENGEGFIRETKNDAILLEPFFGDNEEDCKRFNQLGYYGFAEILNKLVEYYKTL